MNRRPFGMLLVTMLAGLWLAGNLLALLLA